MTRTGIVAALVGLAAVVLVFIVVPGMRDAGFIIRSYVITVVIVAGYIWLLSRRLQRVEKDREARKKDAAT